MRIFPLQELGELLDSEMTNFLGDKLFDDSEEHKYSEEFSTTDFPTIHGELSKTELGKAILKHSLTRRNIVEYEIVKRFHQLEKLGVVFDAETLRDSDFDERTLFILYGIPIETQDFYITSIGDIKYNDSLFNILWRKKPGYEVFSTIIYEEEPDDNKSESLNDFILKRYEENNELEINLEDGSFIIE